MVELHWDDRPHRAAVDIVAEEGAIVLQALVGVLWRFVEPLVLFSLLSTSWDQSN